MHLGLWSDKAAKEAEKYGNVNYVVPKTDTYSDIPTETNWKLDPAASYVYYCANETISGKQMKPDIFKKLKIDNIKSTLFFLQV